MKKICLLVISLFLIPVVALAEDNPKVLTLTSKVDGANINYSGTMEDGSHAVMCKLYNSSDEEIDLLSSPVDEGKFSASFTVTEKGEYKVSCANYEGGEIKTTEAKVTEVKTDNPDTYDAGIKKSVIALVVSTVLIIGYVVYTVKSKKTKKN